MFYFWRLFLIPVSAIAVASNINNDEQEATDSAGPVFWLSVPRDALLDENSTVIKPSLSMAVLSKPHSNSSGTRKNKKRMRADSDIMSKIRAALRRVQEDEDAGSRPSSGHRHLRSHNKHDGKPSAVVKPIADTSGHDEAQSSQEAPAAVASKTKADTSKSDGSKGGLGAGAGEPPHADKQPQGLDKILAKYRDSGRLFFLFMSDMGLRHDSVWNAFFAQADKDQYRTFLHCQSHTACELHLKSHGNVLGTKLVRTTRSKYCEDLVSPMVTLLKAALEESHSRRDKFIYISDSTLPVKPFDIVYKALSSDQGSDFCISPGSAWGHLNAIEDKAASAFVVKHSQWVVLSQLHARLVVQRWPEIQGTNGRYWSIPVMERDTSYHDFNFGKGLTRTKLCTDEWAIFAAVYGAIPGMRSDHVELQGLNYERGETSLRLDSIQSTHGQGVCRTFSSWGEAEHVGDFAVLRRLGPVMSCYPICDTSHPAEFMAVSDIGLGVLRESPYLFARKFPAASVNVRQFRKVILNERDMA